MRVVRLIAFVVFALEVPETGLLSAFTDWVGTVVFAIATTVVLGIALGQLANILAGLLGPVAYLIQFKLFSVL